MEGRATGEKGEFMAGDYLASMLKFMGIAPAGDKEITQLTREQRWSGLKPEELTSYFQNVPMIKYLETNSEVSLSTSSYSIIFQENVDYIISSNPISTDFIAPIVFVGYGFTDEKTGYDDYKGIDIKNKIIIRLYGFPGYRDKDSEGYKKFSSKTTNDYSVERNKNSKAKEKGALAIINLVPNSNIKSWATNEIDLSKNEKPFPPLYQYPLEIKTDSIKTEPLRINASNAMMNLILENSGINIADFENRVGNTLKPESKIIKEKNLKVSTKSKRELINTRNVLGVIEGENKDEIIVIGGHYDHLGIDNGFIWNGADDNASGTVGVWMLAKAFAASGVKPKKTIVFAAWTGEERGLLGSEFFAQNPYGGSIEKIKLYVNYDMISKDSQNDTLKNQARMVYTKSSEKFESISKKNIEEYKINLDMIYRPSENPRGGSDHSSFSTKNVPIMYFMAGFPTDYHTPTDETDDINWNKMIDIIKLTFLNVWEIANE
ncbi:MAG: M20/M25/M40 family metallo-hydrolase [Bacteroidales bacterium]